MSDDDTQHFPETPMPRRPKRPESGAPPFTHTAFAFQRIGKKWGIYREVGTARLPPCPHCGASYTAKIKAFLNRLPVGGFSGGLLFEAAGTPPPQITRDHPGQAEVDEEVLLPEA
jgi:hypothetical protein